jgi:hypothetical protein
MKFFKILFLLLININLVGLFAATDFIIKSSKQNFVKGSRNTLKEKLGEVAKSTVNSTTAMGSIVGKLKIEFAGIAEKSCKVNQLCQLQKNDGQMQVQLSEIQNCFTSLIENLIDNKGFFKKASRGDLSGVLAEMDEVYNLMQGQVKKFEQLNIFVLSPEQVCQQFYNCATELKKIEGKVKGLKCLKKS